MNNLRRVFILLIAVFIAGKATAQDQAEAAPTFSPVEIYACNFKKGQGQADLDKAIAAWNKWMDETGKEPYSAWVYTADYNSPEYAFDVAWLGAWPDGNAMGRLGDRYFSDGGAVAKGFDKVLNCGAHSNWASMQVREGASEKGENAVLQFSDCTIGKDSSMEASMAAVTKWNAYQAEQGSTASQWVFFPVYGGETDYDFKMVTAHTNYTSLGADYERYGNGGGFMKAREMIGNTFDCGNARVYRSKRVRSGLPE